MARTFRIIGLAILLFLVAAAFFVWHENRARATKPPPPLADVLPAEFKVALASQPQVPKPAESGRLEGELKIELVGNGFDLLRATARNTTKSPRTASLSAGAVFESPRSAVIALETRAAEVPPGQSVSLDVPVAPLRLSNDLVAAAYAAGPAAPEEVQSVLAAAVRQKAAPAVVRTAILALNDAAPLQAVAKFPTPESDLPTGPDYRPFRVETGDILRALLLLREAGIPDGRVALAREPQLQIEALIRPETHPLALEVYRLGTREHWARWRQLLVEGEPGTRHYALYGIGRYFPEIGVKMLPVWMNSPQVPMAHRVAAVHALSQTHRPEALAPLEQLRDATPAESELGQASRHALRYLRGRLPAVGTPH